MNPDIKVRWVEALRSNNYKQAKGYLKTEDGFCCLGVLCDIAVQDGVIAAPVKQSNTFDLVHYGYGRAEDTGELPTEVADWAGLDSYNPLVREDDESLASLVDWNDDYGYNFHQIAKLIEDNL
jgi:hypothetical protein